MDASSESVRESDEVQMTRRLAKLMDSTGYPLIQNNGQRIYGPPPNWKGEEPPRGCELFIGKIPRNAFEDELVPILSTIGVIYEFRLMLDFSGTNRGYGFVKYTNVKDAKQALKQLDRHPLRDSRLRVVKSTDNRRLYMGNIPKNLTKDDVYYEISMMAPGITRVIMHNNPVNKAENRGFAFVEFENHRMAAMARRSMIPGGIRLWESDITIDWAQPEHEVDEDIMKQIKALYLRNLPLEIDESVIIKVIRPILGQPLGSARVAELGHLTRVKKIRDFAFVHFSDRATAEQVLAKLENGIQINGILIEAEWAKPPSREPIQRRRKYLEKPILKMNSHAATSVSSSTENNSYMNNFMVNQTGTHINYYNNNNSYQSDNFNYEREHLPFTESFWADWLVLDPMQLRFQTRDTYLCYNMVVSKFQLYNIDLPDFKLRIEQGGNGVVYQCVGIMPKCMQPRYYFLSSDYYYNLEDAFHEVLSMILNKLWDLISFVQPAEFADHR